MHMKETSEEPSAFERAVFVRDGFGWWAFLFGPLWLLWNRAWLALLVWIVLHAGLSLLVQNKILDAGPQVLLELVIALALGFEASTLRRYVLNRRGYQMVDVVQERRLIDAELRFFARHEIQDTAALPRVAVGAGPAPLVGLFPSAGA